MTIYSSSSSGQKSYSHLWLYFFLLFTSNSSAKLGQWPTFNTYSKSTYLQDFHFDLRPEAGFFFSSFWNVGMPTGFHIVYGCLFKKKKFIYLFLAVLGLCCWADFCLVEGLGLLSSWGSRDNSLVAAPYCGGFSYCRAWALECLGFSNYGIWAH